jgi:ribosome-associated translation inhibitor RaiA
VVHNETFPAGIELLIDDLSLGPIKGSGDCIVVLSKDPLTHPQLNPTRGIRLDGHIEPFSLGNVLSLKEAQMTIILMVGSPITFTIESSVTLLGTECDTNVTLADNGASAKIAFISPGLQADLMLATGSQDPLSPGDFYVGADLTIGPWLAQRLPVLAKEDEDSWTKQLSDAQAQVDGLQKDIDKLDAEIQQRSQNDTESKQKAEAALQSAQDAVAKAKAKVDDLQSQIDDANDKLKKCKTWDLTCKAKYGGIVASLTAAKVTADGALNLAKQVLKAAEDELAKIPDPDVDPQIILWKANVVADQAAIASVDATLGSLRSLIKVAADTVAAGASALSTKTLRFSSDSWVKLQGGSPGSTHLVGTFLGHNVDVNVGMMLTDVEKFAENTWKSLSKLASEW